MPSLQAPSRRVSFRQLASDSRSPDTGNGPVSFSLDPPTALEGTKRHTLRFTAVRQLKGRFYSQQRHVPGESISFNGLHLATNRTFDAATENETTVNRNAFAQHVFGTTSLPLVLSPIDRWTLELPMELNPCVVGVSSTDVKQYDLSELSDAVLALEYNIRGV